MGTAAVKEVLPCIVILHVCFASSYECTRLLLPLLSWVWWGGLSPWIVVFSLWDCCARPTHSGRGRSTAIRHWHLKQLISTNRISTVRKTKYSGSLVCFMTVIVVTCTTVCRLHCSTYNGVWMAADGISLMVGGSPTCILDFVLLGVGCFCIAAVTLKERPLSRRVHINKLVFTIYGILLNSQMMYWLASFPGTQEPGNGAEAMHKPTHLTPLLLP